MKQLDFSKKPITPVANKDGGKRKSAGHSNLDAFEAKIRSQIKNGSSRSTAFSDCADTVKDRKFDAQAARKQMYEDLVNGKIVEICDFSSRPPSEKDGGMSR